MNKLNVWAINTCFCVYTLTLTPHPRPFWSYSMCVCTVWTLFRTYRPLHPRLPQPLLSLLQSRRLMRSELPDREKNPTHTHTQQIIRVIDTGLDLYMKTLSECCSLYLLIGFFVGSFLLCCQTRCLVQILVTDFTLKPLEVHEHLTKMFPVKLKIKNS